MPAFNIDCCKALDAYPGGNFQLFQDYTEQMELLFRLGFRKADGTPYMPTDADKKAMLLFKGGKATKTICVTVPPEATLFAAF